MEYEINEGVLELAKIFCKYGHKLYLVGGCVRNMLLGLKQGDLDVCSAALPEASANIAKKEGCTIIEKALSLGTIEIHLKHNGNKYIFEHTTLRQDYYKKGGEHRPYRVEFTDDITLDAKRRDFTVNALYLDVENKEILDPTGRGFNDIENKVLRAAADKAIDTLGDDGLRIMRMVRLSAQLGFAIAPDLLECAKSNVHLLNDITAERKQQELKRILMADVKYGKKDAHLKGLLLLSNIGAFKYVIPELERGRGVEQKKEYHSNDVLHHNIHTCGAALPHLPLRLAALLHDIGKPEAIKVGGNMYNHDIYGAGIAEKEIENLKFDNKTKKTVVTLIRNHMFDLEGKAKPKTIRKRAIKLGRENFKMLIELRRADVAGSGYGAVTCLSAENWQAELKRMIGKNVPWSVKDLNITGQDIIEATGKEPSEEIGSILDELFRYCIIYPSANKKEILIKRVTKNK